MIPKKNKYIKYLLIISILASCSSTPDNIITLYDEPNRKAYQRDLHDLNAYNAFFVNDLEIIQQKIDNQKLSQGELNDLKLLKKNYQKILKKK